MASLIGIMQSIVEAVARDDRAAVLACVADDVEYHYHVGSPPLRGKEQFERFLAKYKSFAADAVWRIDRHAENGDLLLVEGYEEYTDLRTGKRVAHPYMGICQFRNGRIVRWRDYFEMDGRPLA